MIWAEKQVGPGGLAAEPRSRTSPTIFETMRECMYRSGFERDPVYRKDRIPSPQIVIGHATHKLKEVATRGDLSGLSEADRRAAAARLWEEEIAKGHGEMVGLALGNPPNPQGWANYQSSRISAIKELERSATGPVFPNDGISAEPEVLLTAHDGAISGRVDLVLETADGVEIIDYKTGELSEPENQTSAEPCLKSAYKRQLLMYAYLYQQRFGQWPVRVTAQKTDGSQSFSFSPDQSEAAMLAHEALELLDRFNRDAKAGSLQATPSPEACRNCPFKAACPSFFNAAGPDWDLGHRFSVKGQIASMTPATGLGILDGTAGNVAARPIPILKVPRRFFELRNIADTVSFSDLSGGPDNGLRFLWWSRSWKWGQSEIPA